MTHRRALLSTAALAAMALFLFGCPKGEETTTVTTTTSGATAPRPVTPTPTAPAPPARASAVADVTGAAVNGTVTFTDTGNGVAIEAHFTGLTPGKHGFHIHQGGECVGDFASAGDHFNPGGHQHGGPDSTEAHEGDFGNLLAGADGTAMITMTSRHVTLDSGPSGIIGKTVLVHEKEDDLATQPSGNSGARIACGVIRLNGGGAAPAGGGATGATGEMPGGASGASGATGP